MASKRTRRTAGPWSRSHRRRRELFRWRGWAVYITATPGTGRRRLFRQSRFSPVPVLLALPSASADQPNCAGRVADDPLWSHPEHELKVRRGTTRPAASDHLRRLAISALRFDFRYSQHETRGSRACSSEGSKADVNTANEISFPHLKPNEAPLIWPSRKT